MAGKVITIAQHKGGAGKTTFAAQLAAGLDQTGAKVITLDVDPQGSLTQWQLTRTEKLGRRNKIAHLQLQGWKVMRELGRMIQEFDYVIIDTPPHAESETSIAIRQADLVLIPIQPSPLDIWACGPTLKLVLQERRPLMLALNRVPPRAKLNTIMMDKLEDMNIPVSRQTLGNRVAFSSSIMQGLGVVESEPSSAAAQEVKALLSEILKQKAFKGATSKVA
jgi:chromosome partitioning protein